MLEVRLLGQFDLRLEGRAVELASRPAQSLLAYLLLNPGVPHRREKLSGLLWPEATEANARSNLRHALWRIRKALETGLPAARDYLQVDEISVAYAPSADCWQDTAVLERKLAGEGSAEELMEIVGVYRGELLPGFYDDWVVLERERLQASFEHKMGRLLERLVAEGRWPQVLEWGERWVALGQTPEPAYRALMAAHAGLGDLSRMAGVYRRCVEALKRELGVEPSAQTRELYERLSRGEPLPRIDLAPAVPAAAESVEGPPAPGESPFKGLQNFEESDAELFFGRERLTARLVEHLREHRSPIVIVGASGSGKSSLVRAGLIPTLKGGRPLDEGRMLPAESARWPVHLITPTAHPLEALAVSLTRESPSLADTASLLDDLARDRRSLGLAVRKLLTRQPHPTHLLLVIDQFEELFTLCREEAEREAFVDNLLTATAPDGGPTLIALTLRADFYAHCARYPELREALARHQEYIGPMSAEELRRAIEEPARRGGWEFEGGLVDLLLREVGDEPGALPLLSHALLETWNRRQGRKLTLRGYAESGGVRGAIARTADTVFNHQLTAEQQTIARGIFLRLTELGEGTQDTRRRASLPELFPRPEDAQAVEAVLTMLTDARLIIAAEGTAEVAHEALIQEWPTLRGWLRENREGLRLHRHLTEAAQAWEGLERDAGELYRGARLAQAQEWARTHGGELNALERAFLEASREWAVRREVEREAARQRELEAAQKLAEAETRRAQEQGRAARQLRRRALVLAGVSLVAGALAVVAVLSGRQAGQNAQLAEANASFAQTAEARAVAEEAHAEAASTQAVAEQMAAELARATADGERQRAENEAQRAERAAREATSRELAAAAISNLDVDAELSVLLALQAVETTYTLEAENALHQAVQALRGLHTLSGHDGSVENLAFSPDGTRLATASQDSTAKVWDAASGQMIHTLVGHTGPIGDIAFSPDGTLLATGGGDGTARIWDAASGQELFTLPALTRAVAIVGFSPDGTRLATAGLDGKVKIWETASGEELIPLAGHADRVHGVAFSPDGTRVATASKDGTAKVWDAATGEELSTLTGHAGAVRAIAFSPGGELLATASVDGTAKVWDVSAGGGPTLLFTLPGHSASVFDVAFNPDGTRLATAGQDGIVKVWDIASGRDLFTLSGHRGSILDVAFSPDGGRLATASADGAAKVWDAFSGQELFGLAGHAARIVRLAFSPDGRRLATASQDGTARVWDLTPEGGREWLTLSGEADPISRFARVAFSPDGGLLAAAGLDGLVRVWDADTGLELFVLSGHLDEVLSVEFNPDGTRLVTGSQDGTGRVWEISPEGGEHLLTLIGHIGGVMDAAFSPDGTLVATASQDGTAKVWDAVTGEPLFPVVGHTGAVRGVAFSPDGTRLATSGTDGTAKVWDISAEQAIELFTLSGHAGSVEDIAFSPDGTRLATASQDATAKVWDAATRQELFPLESHTGGLRDLAISADGRRLATASLDGTSKVWDAASGDELLTLSAHTQAVLGVAFSPDGRRLATASVDGTVRVYLLRIDELVALARERVTGPLTGEECQKFLHGPCPSAP